jgi:hypothetical protein
MRCSGNQRNQSLKIFLELRERRIKWLEIVQIRIDNGGGRPAIPKVRSEGLELKEFTVVAKEWKLN